MSHRFFFVSFWLLEKFGNFLLHRSMIPSGLSSVSVSGVVDGSGLFCSVLVCIDNVELV